MIINSEEKAIKIKQSLNNNDIVNFKSYTTSKDQDLAYTLNSESHIVIPERSIVTVVSDLK